MASEDTELPSRTQSTIHGGNPANAASPRSSTDVRAAIRSLTEYTRATSIVASSNPYVAFLEKNFDASKSGYGDVLEWFDRWTREASSWSRLSEHVVYMCFDFCPSPTDHSRSLRTTIYVRPTRQHVPEISPVSGVSRIIIAAVAGFLSTQSLQGLMNDAGVYFKLPPHVFSPFIEYLESGAMGWSIHDAYHEALILRTSCQPLVVHAVNSPGSEPADTTCSKSASRSGYGTDTMQSLSCPVCH